MGELSFWGSLTKGAEAWEAWHWGTNWFPPGESDLRPHCSCRRVKSASSRMWRRVGDRGEPHYGGKEGVNNSSQRSTMEAGGGQSWGTGHSTDLPCARQAPRGWQEGLLPLITLLSLILLIAPPVRHSARPGLSCTHGPLPRASLSSFLSPSLFSPFALSLPAWEHPTYPYPRASALAVTSASHIHSSPG